jgi:histidinol-phosphatase (PHP family)
VLPSDNHVHSEWSFDTGSEASMVAACGKAVALGLPAIAFTEHVEFTDWAVGDAAEPLELGWWSKIRPLDASGYFASIAECRERFPGLRVRSGIEAGEAHLFAGSIKAVLAQGTFDRILGSVHAIPYQGRLAAVDELWAELDADEVMRRYLAEVVTMVAGSGAFQVLAHVDYPRRYWPHGPANYREADFEEEYRAVFRELASTDRALELNTKSPLASVRLLRWWREEGGRAVSFGSDAHLPWQVGGRFDLAADIVEAAGFGPGRDPGDFWRIRATAVSRASRERAA